MQRNSNAIQVGDFENVMVPLALTPYQKKQRFWQRFSLVASIAAHVVLAVLLTLQLSSRGGVPQRVPLQAVMIIRPASTTAAATAPVPSIAEASQKEPTPPEPPKPQQTPVPKPKPKPSPTPKAKPPAEAQASAKPQAPPQSASKKPPPSAAGEPADRIGDSGESPLSTLLNGVRENWLQPAGPRSMFRCRVKITYQPGGIVTGVSVLQGCGNAALDDSVQRAIWKTQPLPLDPQSIGISGSVVLEFTP